MRLRTVPAPLLVLGLAAVATLSALLLAQRLAPAASAAPGADVSQRIVSLSPAATEILFALGADSAVVAVSQFCDQPAAARSRPRAGTGLTPHYERIAAAQPTVIVTAGTPIARLDALQSLAPTVQFPWLTTEDVIAGTLALGALSGRRQGGERLAARLATELAPRVAPDAPRVLLLLGGAEAGAGLWYLGHGTLHGSAIAAAGGRNVAPVGGGPPLLGLERLLSLDPESIVIVGGGEAGAGATLASLQALTTLTAARAGRLHALPDPGLLVPGPRILELVARLRLLFNGDEAR